MKRSHAVIGAILALVTSPTVSSATNGYLTHGFGTESKAMAGAGVALPLGPMSAATNPAAIVFAGDQVAAGLAVFNPNRDYTVTGAPSGYPGTFGLAPGTVKSGSRVFPVPYAGMTRSFGPRQAASLILYGNGGMNTDYHAATFGVSPAGVDLAQMFVAPTYARRLTATQALGASAVLGWQRFSARGLSAFAPFSQSPGDLTDRGYANAWGAGVRAGYLGRWRPWLSIGASYQSRVWMTEFSRYCGLFCEQGRFDVPSNWTAGVAITPRPRLDLAADVQRTNYSEVRAVGRPLLPNLQQRALGADGGPGFGWNDVTTLKLGAQLRAGAWTWRGGWSHGNQPVPGSEVLFNILAPGVIRDHATLGFTRAMGARRLNVAVTRAFSNRVSGPNPLEAPGQQHIALRMDEWEAEVGFAWALR